jgi:hypothetical protein
MKTIRKGAIALLASVAVLVVGGATLGQTPTLAVQAPVLKQRVVRAKPARTILTPKLRSDVIVVKFREGTRVRERLGQLEADLTNITPAEEQLLQAPICRGSGSFRIWRKSITWLGQTPSGL